VKQAAQKRMLQTAHSQQDQKTANRNVASNRSLVYDIFAIGLYGVQHGDDCRFAAGDCHG
jgi:hypothetical protein